jgi:hypothetical protein
MSKLLLVLAVAVIGMMPVSVSAQGQPPVAQATESLDPARLVLIGAGILVGAVAMEVLVAGDLAILVGAATGGILTDWWYRTKDYKSAAQKTAFREAALPVPSGFKLAMLPGR